jgi:YggT family protein
MFLIKFFIDFVFTVADAILLIYFWVLIIRVIISWVAADSYHPLIRMVYQITEPVLAPVRRIIPPIGGLDFSVLIVIIFVQMVRTQLLPRLLVMLTYSSPMR